MNSTYTTIVLYCRRVWNWSYASLGIFLPLTLLAFCNICLVRVSYSNNFRAGSLASSVGVIARSNPSQVPPLHMHAGSDWLCASYQEVGTCSTRGGSRGEYITFASAKSEKKFFKKVTPIPYLDLPLIV